MSEVAKTNDAQFSEAKVFDYIAEANVTASNKFHGELISPAHIRITLDRAVEALQELDYIKKALFYGREVPANCKHYLAPSVHGTSEKITRAVDPENGQRAELLFHSIVGIATEAGELLEMLRNVTFNGQPFDNVNFVEEIGDVFWYQAIGINCVPGENFGSVQIRNIAKLRHRFPQKFTEYDANNRDLFGERKILAGEVDLDTPAGMSYANDVDRLAAIAKEKGKPLASIENWTYDPTRDCIWGNVSNHPNQTYLERDGNDKAFVHTSRVVEMQPELGYAETANTIYRLGKAAD